MSVFAKVADTVLGERVPAAELPHPVPEGVTVRRNRLIPALGGLFGWGGKAAAAVTLRGTILVNPQARLDDALLVHELVHVEQWKEDPLFAAKYVGEWLRRGYRGNRYEVEAYAREREFRATRDITPPRAP